MYYDAPDITLVWFGIVRFQVLSTVERGQLFLGAEMFDSEQSHSPAQTQSQYCVRSLLPPPPRKLGRTTAVL